MYYYYYKTTARRRLVSCLAISSTEERVSFVIYLIFLSIFILPRALKSLVIENDGRGADGRLFSYSMYGQRDERQRGALVIWLTVFRRHAISW